MSLVGPGIIFLSFLLSSLYEQTEKRIRLRTEKAHAKHYVGGVGTGGLVGPKTLFIHDKGVAFLTSEDYSQNRWGSLSAIFVLEDSILVFNTPATFNEVPRSQVKDDNFEKACALLKEKAPANLIRTKFDFPL